MKWEENMSNEFKTKCEGSRKRKDRFYLSNILFSSILKDKQVENWQDFRTNITNFENDLSQRYEDIDANREVIMNDYRQIIDNIDQQMNKYFSSACQPATKCAVERVPAFKEATSPGAYYFPAALDGKTPGTFFINLRDIKEVLKYKMYALAYHEAVPGHHFQVDIFD